MNKKGLNFPFSFNSANVDDSFPKIGLIFMKISKIGVYAFFFLLPLFFLPSPLSIFNILEFQKQSFLIFFSLFSGLSWLFYIIISHRFKIRKSLLNLLISFFVLTALISTIFSNFRYGSFWGEEFPFSSTTSLLTIFSFFIFYLIIVNLFSKEELLSLFLTVIISGFAASLLFLANLFNRFTLPFISTIERPFNTIGPNNFFALYLVLMLILLIPLFLIVKKYLKLILGIFGLTFLFVLLLIDFEKAWIVLSLGLIFMFILSAVILKERLNPVFTIAFIFLTILSFFLSFIHFSSSDSNYLLSLFPELGVASIEDNFNSIPSLKENLNVLSQILSGFNIKELLIGSGPGTFYYNWSKYNSPEINQNSFWFTFAKPSSELFNVINDFGFLPVLVLILIIFTFIKASFKEFLKEAELLDVNQKGINRERILLWGITSGFLAFLFLFVLYPTNISLLTLGLLLISSFSLLIFDKQKTYYLYSSPLFITFGSFLIISILVLVLGTGFFYGQKFVAQIKYQKAVNYFHQGNIEEVNNLILEAIHLNPKADIFWRDLSKVYLIKIEKSLAKNDLDKEELDFIITDLINKMISSAKKATEINKISSFNWKNLAFIYQSLIGIVNKSEDAALNSYEEARKLEPNNPYILTEMGKIYALKADSLSLLQDGQGYEENLKLAQEKIEKAIELKPDYVPAYLQQAIIYIKRNKVDEAIMRLETIKQLAFFDIDLAYNLGTIYYYNKQIDKAKDEFRRAVFINPDHSNSRYFLGIILDKEGDKKGALLHFKKIQQLNPNNEEIKKIVENLENGKSALDGIISQEPLIQEEKVIDKGKNIEGEK